MKYYMTSTDDNRWWFCNASTLLAAKKAATLYYRGGFVGSIIKVAAGDGITEERQILAQKRNDGYSTWQNI